MPLALRDLQAAFAAHLAQVGDAGSVSDIEEYAGCPSRWFIRRHLLPRDAEPAASRRIVGALVHEVLARVVPAMAGPQRWRLLEPKKSRS